MEKTKRLGEKSENLLLGDQKRLRQSQVSDLVRCKKLVNRRKRGEGEERESWSATSDVKGLV
jgi:hypothetical protein